ncbi:Hypothetical predicted protein [Olea europaea subsp. europaea]|uniref:Uncharacterized protein n=1 Tax=Olea europaea subsp. europaea TaxID=158383 RepID=A0A8S0PGW8_OLEEU|nr:Hypothetical predicted protein [Olea europaea subsp. europaea]
MESSVKRIVIPEPATTEPWSDQVELSSGRISGGLGYKPLRTSGKNSSHGQYCNEYAMINNLVPRQGVTMPDLRQYHLNLLNHLVKTSQLRHVSNYIQRMIYVIMYQQSLIKEAFGVVFKFGQIDKWLLRLNDETGKPRGSCLLVNKKLDSLM